MSTASARPAPSTWPRRATAVVVGGDSPARRRTARLLAEAGFGVWAAASPGDLAAHVQAEPAAIVALPDHSADADRVREVRTLAEAHPEAVLLAVMPSDAANASLRRTLLAGATGIVLDDELERALVPSLRAMFAGQLAVPTGLGRLIAPRPLSHREKQILALVMLGATNREIAGKLFLAESTVKTHLSSAFRKLDARSRSEAVARIQDPEAGYGAGILAIADGLAAA